MKEIFLHHVWKSLFYNPGSLTTQDGRKVEVISPGRLNVDQGPDFLNAELRIGEEKWFGHVEIHVHSEDWYRHGHQRDANYNAVVLHVVYESNGKEIIREDGTSIPEVTLQGGILADVLVKHQQLVTSKRDIPCGPMLRDIPQLHIGNWLDRLGVERLQVKIGEAQKRLQETVQDWEQVLWEELAAILGGPVNQHAFRELAREVPIRILKKYAKCSLKVEALLYGASGLLGEQVKGEKYVEYLRAEWGHLSFKHDLGMIRISMKRLRMRPPGFPSVRISQLANLIWHFPDLNDLLLEGGSEALLNVSIQASMYWDTHYLFGKPGPPKVKKLGRPVKEAMITNTLLPITYLYHYAHGREEPPGGVAERLEKMRPEENRIVRMFRDHGIKPENALRSQGMVRLKKVFCDQKKCLTCALGLKIIKREEACKLIPS